MSDFPARHIGPRDHELQRLAVELGYDAPEDLARAAVPAALLWEDDLDLPPALDEAAMLAHLRTIASRNTVLTSHLGLGYYGTHTPAVIRRNILENPAWYTAYTPYQPEISQGRLEALLNFQTMVCDLTGLDIASSSLLDEATAAAEAMTLMRRSSASKSHRCIVDADTHPQTIAVLATRAEPLGIELVMHDFATGLPLADYFGVLCSYPGSTGAIRDPRPAIAHAHAHEALATVICDPLALTMLEAPGVLGADVAVGSAQRFGVPMGFGGPHAGFMAVRKGLERSMPGRLVGVSVDAEGRPAYRLALQTREQHIRREKATSNICTAQVLLAVMASMYAVYHGRDGLLSIGARTNALAQIAAASLAAGGFTVRHGAFFDTIAVGDAEPAALHVVRARAAGFNVRVIDERTIGVAFDETTTLESLEALLRALGVELVLDVADASIPGDLARATDFLTHPVFNAYASETEMMRYLRRLADKDLALDRTMIPLGSCTMKLTAASEMEAVSWPEFADLHPFAPLDPAAGTVALIAELEGWLAEITGYDAVSVQPNAGSQGEFAGLLAISAFHRASGQAQRNVCLIPSSAHGTNAASAVMAGMRVVVVACDEHGNVDVEDLRAKVAAHREDLSALMVTYPSTHGVFEAAIPEICALVHDAGGQVYVDGANLNALVGLARPGRFGADVSHLNLHKTFAIPHGGGGPGVGPVAVRAHLAPYLPSHPLVAQCGPTGRGYADGGVGPVSAAPWGSAGVLQIPYAYIRMMGAEGLRDATVAAIVNANYLARKLEPHFPVLYRGNNGLVAHECIIDLRPLSKATGVTVDDVAKRLMDAGFHAPAMSFPVPGTLMIEPTESESVAELDRFVQAMIVIREEIRAIERGDVQVQDSPLRHAPHTAEALLGEWDRAYPRTLGAFPMGVPALKYWPPVARIDGAYGDRNLVCSCPAPEAYAD